MLVRTARRLLFALAALALPLPTLGPYAAVVPPARHLILFAATAAVAALEGAAGPVRGILTLFAINAAVTFPVAWFVAWLAARLTASLSPGVRRALVLGTCALFLLVALAFDLYRDPFGRAPTTNLWGVLS